MAELLSVVAFAIALSMDGFGAGIVYGTRRIRVPLTSLMVIGLASSTAVGISMTFGHIVSGYVSIRLAEFAGSLILILMGLRILLQGAYNRKKCTTTKDSEPGLENGNQVEQILKLRIKSLGLVVQILREPVAADIDKSGHISFKEALLLSLALAIDAMVAGFGAAMAGFKPFLTPFILGPVSAIWVSLGVFIGRRYTAKWLGDKAETLPGWLLIILGLARVIKI